MSRRRIDCASFHAETPLRARAGALGVRGAVVPEGCFAPLTGTVSYGIRFGLTC
jgi:hypothetical protein